MPPIAVSRTTALAAAAALLLILVVVGQRLAASGTASAPALAAPLEVAEQPRERPLLVVHVVGAVRRPGLLRLREGARVADAVARAGGATAKADLAALNLAAPLVDGIQVLVPVRVAPVTTSAGAPPAGVSGVAAPRLSLATATAEDLDELPGVGPVTAQKILDYRAEHGPFASVDDLDAVPGIGPATVEELRDLVTP
jgi:competence protein ComEA